MLITKVETTLFSGDMDDKIKKIDGHTGGITREEITVEGEILREWKSQNFQLIIPQNQFFVIFFCLKLIR